MLKQRLETEAGYVMVEWSKAHSCYVWTCEWGHWAFDFESTEEARQDFLKHDCRRTI